MRALHGPHNRPEKDLDLDLIQIAILKFHHVVKAFLANRPLGLLKSLVMTLDDCPAYRTLALFITFHASFKRHVEKDHRGGGLALLGQIEQIFPRLAGQRRRVHHAEPVHGKPLLYKEMYQRKGLCVEALITLVVAHQRPRPIRGDDLSGPKVPLGKCGFSASRRAA